MECHGDRTTAWQCALVEAGSWHGGPLVGFDLETTGLDPAEDEPVSYAFVTFNRGLPVSVEAGYLIPERPISPGATEVHGLTVEHLRLRGASRLAEGVAHIARRLGALSAEGIPIVGCNLSFDLTIVDRLCAQLHPALALSATDWRGPALDVLVLDRAFDEDFEARPRRRLELLCDHYGVIAPTHAAASDAQAAVRVLLQQAQRFAGLAELGLGELHRRQVTWHARWRAGRTSSTDDGQLRLFDVREEWPYVPRVLAH